MTLGLSRIRALFGGAAYRIRSSGDHARDHGVWAEAVVQYRAYLELRPRDFAIWVQLGHACKESGNHAAARYAYDRAIELDGSNFDVHLNKGHLEKLLGHKEAAVASYRKAFDLNPMDPNVARELVALGGYDPALAAGPSSALGAREQTRPSGRPRLMSSTKLKSEIRRLRANRYLRKAQLERAAGRPEAAMTAYMRAFLLNPADGVAPREIASLKWGGPAAGAVSIDRDESVALDLQSLGVDGRAGWREEEAKVRWISGRRARLKFSTEFGAKSEVRFYLRAQAASHLSPEEAGMRIIVGGRPNAFAGLEIDATWLVATGWTDTDGGVSIDLECADSMGRQRPGGFLLGLSAMAFCASDDVLGRIAILEKIRSVEQVR
jgi:tetratricopeptide (TPR) repeat protein